MKRRSFVKQSIAGAIVAATPLALTGLVRADGGGGNTTTTNESTDFWNSTDWWGSTEATVPWESTIWESTVMWESTVACESTTPAMTCRKGDSVRLKLVYAPLQKLVYFCANYVECQVGIYVYTFGTDFTMCDDPNDNAVTSCIGITTLTNLVDVNYFIALPVCEP